MKKILGLLLICVAFALTGCGNNEKLITISFTEFEKKINNEESFMLVIGSATCSHCQNFRGTLNDVLKEYNVNIYYIDISAFEEGQEEKFLRIVNFSGTPTTVFIEKGIEESPGFNRLSGSVPRSKVIDALKANGYIKDGVK